MRVPPRGMPRRRNDLSVPLAFDVATLDYFDVATLDYMEALGGRRSRAGVAVRSVVARLNGTVMIRTDPQRNGCSVRELPAAPKT